MASFKCADIGMTRGFETTAPIKEELLLKTGIHAGDVHKMTSVPQDVLKAINKAMKI
jgi:predicted small metal-binding protein